MQLSDPQSLLRCRNKNFYRFIFSVISFYADTSSWGQYHCTVFSSIVIHASFSFHQIVASLLDHLILPLHLSELKFLGAYFASNHLCSDCVVELPASNWIACSYPQNSHDLSVDGRQELRRHADNGGVGVGLKIRINLTITCRENPSFEPRSGASLHQPVGVINLPNTRPERRKNIHCPGPRELAQDFQRGRERVRHPTNIYDGGSWCVVATPLESRWCEFNHHGIQPVSLPNGS